MGAWRLGLIACAFLGTTFLSACRTQLPGALKTPTVAAPDLLEIGRFTDQVTGVAVSSQGRIFVNFPHWVEPPLFSVAELKPDGSLRPYPNATWNSGETAGGHPESSFICVQSVYVDRNDKLWILDPASPGFKGVVAGGAKLVKIDLKTDRVEQVIHFDEEIAPKRSYLNDVRIDEGRGIAYITDSGLGAIVVVDLKSGAARRLLEHDPSTKAEPVQLVVEGKDVRDESGKTPQINVDGIALDDTRDFLYYHALSGRTLYGIDTRYLRDTSVREEQLPAFVEKSGITSPPDGMFMDDKGNLFLTDLEKSAVTVRRPDGSVHMVITDAHLVWPDSLAIGPDGNLFVTSSQINRMPRFNGGTDKRQPPYQLFRIYLPDWLRAEGRQ